MSLARADACGCARSFLGARSETWPRAASLIVDLSESLCGSEAPSVRSFLASAAGSIAGLKKKTITKMASVPPARINSPVVSHSMLMKPGIIAATPAAARDSTVRNTLY